MTGVTASRWSSEHVVAEYRDLQANAMAVDCKGQYALLAGRRALALVGLDKPMENVQKVGRQSKWEISAVQWSPHQSHHNYFVTACNQRADLCTWGEASCEHQGSLKAHTRVISDLDWSPEEPTRLATCSVDTFTYLWDIREYRKPTVSLQAVAGASQVKYNRVNSNLIATTHDGDIRIWDPRNGTSPIVYIAGHLSKIHGLDWCRTSETHLATSSQDCTVKFWDITNPRQAESKLPSGSPVWRARYTPFGNGLVTVVVPQLRRGENSLFLWHIDDRHQPVHTFVGHSDVVLEFQWRKESDCADYHLVTWSRDQSLRLWRIDSQLQKLCGHDIGAGSGSPDLSLCRGDVDESEEAGENELPGPLPVAVDAQQELLATEDVMMSSTPPNRILRRREEIHSPQLPKTLEQEFHLVNCEIPNVTVDEMDPLNRKFTVTAVSGKHIVQLTMTFPETYPNNTPPTFTLGKTTLDTPMQTKLTKGLRDASLQHVKHNRSCIEPCLRQLTSSLDSLTDTQSGNNLQQPPSFLPIFSGSFNTVSVPFPRTSGARFCGAGFLVCFTRQTEVPIARRTSSNTDLTPRALTALSTFGHSTMTPKGSQPVFNTHFYSVANSPPSDSFSLSNFYNNKDRFLVQKQRVRSKTRPKESSDTRIKDTQRSPKKKAKTGPTIIYDISCLLPVQKQLAETYVLEGDDIAEKCSKNATAAAAMGRKDLVNMWSMLGVCGSKALEPCKNPDEEPWAYHAFGRRLLDSFISHYSAIFDVQTVAMLCCVFGSKECSQRSPASTPSSSTRSPSEQSFNNAGPGSLSPLADTPMPKTLPVSKVKRSNSWSELYEEYRSPDEFHDPSEMEKELHDKNSRLLSTSQRIQYDQYIKTYAAILYRWQLLTRSSEVLKYISIPPTTHEGPEFHVICQHCSCQGRSVQCADCKKPSISCSICLIMIKGSASFCILCGHGGHASHMADWFRAHDVCPTGCGCNCVYELPTEQ